MSIENPIYDKIYRNCFSIIENSSDRNIKRKRERLDREYKKLCETEDYERQEFYSIVHELRLYQYIKDLGITIIAANDNNAGPDFETGIGYIECVSTTKGEPGTPARLCIDERLNQSVNRYVSALPRLTNSISEKLERYKYYLDSNKINKSKPRIIALCTSVFSNEFHSDLNLDLALKILYGIDCRTMRFNMDTNSFIEEPGVEFHAYKDFAIKPPSNISLPLSYFYKDEYRQISGIIVNNNAITEELNKEYFCLLLNPLAGIPIDKTKLEGIKYFELDSVDNNYSTFCWRNQ